MCRLVGDHSISQTRKLSGGAALCTVRCSALILIEAPSSAYHVGLLAPGQHQPPPEEEPFYVATAVKRFLSPLRARRSLLLSRPNDLSGLRPC
jgi:hypothetical protein